MKSRSKTACLFLLMCFAGCKKGEVAKPAGVLPPPASRAVPNPEPRRTVAALDADEAKAILTEDRLSRFATYQREMLSATSDAVGVGMQAFAKGGTDQKKFQGAVAADDRSAKIAAATKAALEKSGLTQDEIRKLNHLATRYYGSAYVLQDAAKKAEELHRKIEKAKADGKQASVVDVAMERAYAGQASQLGVLRKDFAIHYGEQALALMQRHEPEFFAINQKMTGAAMGAMKKQ